MLAPKHGVDRTFSGKRVRSNGEYMIKDLKGWVFAVRTVVFPEHLPDSSTISNPKKKAIEDSRKRIARRFNNLKDYSIHQLYMNC